MSKTVKLPEELYKRLEKYSFGFHQTPTAVIDRVLDELDKLRHEKLLIQREKASPSKFIYGNQLFDKCGLVWRIISDYIAMHDGVNLYQLCQAFPNELHGDLKIAEEHCNVTQQYNGERNTFYSVGEFELLDMPEGKVAVCNDWNAINILNVVERAKQLGFCIEVAEQNDKTSIIARHTHSHIRSTVDEKKNDITTAIKELTSNAKTDVSCHSQNQQPLISNQGGIREKSQHSEDNRGSQQDADDIKIVDSEHTLEKVCKAKQSTESSISKRRRIKYRYKESTLGFAHLVLQIVTDYVDSQPEKIDFDQLTQVFPPDLQGSVGVVNKLEVVFEKYRGRVNHLHFTNDKYLLSLNGRQAAVSTEWRKANIEIFVAHARKLGFPITVEQ